MLEINGTITDANTHFILLFINHLNKHVNRNTYIPMYHMYIYYYFPKIQSKYQGQSSTQVFCFKIVFVYSLFLIYLTT